MIGPGAADRSAGLGRPRRSRGRARRRHRPDRAQRQGGEGATTTSSGLTCGQRRHGARAAEEGRAVHALQGLRHVRARSGPASRSGSTAATCRCRRSSTATCGRIPGRRELIFTIPELVEFISSRHDAAAGRYHFDRHAVGHRPDSARRSGDDSCRGRRRADQSGRGAGRISVMKFFIDTRQPQGHRSARAARHHRRRHDQSVADGEGEAAIRARSSRRSASSCRARSAPRSSRPMPTA